MPYGGHQSVFRGNVVRVWVPISCPSGLPESPNNGRLYDVSGTLPVTSRLALALCTSRRSPLLFPRVAVTQRSIKVRNIASSEQSPLRYPFLVVLMV
jgi:hypothetical protein